MARLDHVLPLELGVESADFKKGGWSPGKSGSYYKGTVTRIRAAGILVSSPDLKERVSPWRGTVDKHSF